MAAIEKYNTAQALLAPFKKITDQWAVGTTHQFQSRIREIHLVASGDLDKDWTVKVVAGTTGVIVAEFSFPEYGRLFDMRKVDYTKPVPVAQFFGWVDSKIDKRQIKYSALADKYGYAMTDPRVIHDIAYRVQRSINKRGLNPKRRRWYNKGKEASLNELYDQLQEAMREALIVAMKADARKVA